MNYGISARKVRAPIDPSASLSPGTSNDEAGPAAPSSRAVPGRSSLCDFRLAGWRKLDPISADFRDARSKRKPERKPPSEVLPRRRRGSSTATVEAIKEREPRRVRSVDSQRSVTAIDTGRREGRGGEETARCRMVDKSINLRFFQSFQKFQKEVAVQTSRHVGG